jgi:hypothetical protein
MMLSNDGIFAAVHESQVLALTAVRCGAQNSVAIGGAADITGLEAGGRLDRK